MRTVALLLLISGRLFPQADTRTCSIDGSVINSVTRAPVPRARIYLAAAGEENFSATTDAAGKWSVPHSPCGKLSVFAEHFGFLEKESGGTPPAALVLSAEAPLRDVSIEITPQSVISGKVLDENGDPLPGAEVALARLGVSKGVRGIRMRVTATSNDLGEYRFSTLAAGRYIICATGHGVGRIPGTLEGRCFPGAALDPAAPSMSVSAGNEALVDLRLAAYSRVTVRGTVSGFPPKTPVTIALFPRELFGADSANEFELTTVAGPDGKFTLRRVPPGAYRAIARTDEQDRKRSRLIPLSVGNQDVEDVTLPMEQAAVIQGTVKVLSVSGKKFITPFDLVMRALSGIQFSDRMVWNEDKTAFSIYGVMPEDYRLEFPSMPPPFYVKSVVYGNRDVIGSDVTVPPGITDLEITVSDDSGSVEGDVSGHGAPASAWVLLLREGSQPHEMRTDNKGHFAMGGIPPGDYTIFAWPSDANVEYANPDWVRRNAKGAPITIRTSEKTTVKLESQTAPAE